MQRPDETMAGLASHLPFVTNADVVCMAAPMEAAHNAITRTLSSMALTQQRLSLFTKKLTRH